MLEALQSRQHTAVDLLGAPGAPLMDTCVRYCQVVYAWAFHFVKDGVLERAFELLRTLTQATSHKSGLRFKGKKNIRHRCLELYVWYYSRISKHSAALDYIQTCRKRPIVTVRDAAVLALLEGFVLSNLERSKEAVRCHHEARELLESREAFDMDDRTLRVCQAVALYNLAAENCNLYQTKEAAPYIRQAGQLANVYLPEGLQLKEKINSLYEEVLGTKNTYIFQAPFQSQPDSEKIGESLGEARSASPIIKERRVHSRPPVQRRPEKDLRLKVMNGPMLRKSRKSPHTSRWRGVVAAEGQRPTSSSIGPNSPTASKSSSANPHRRKRTLKNNIDYGYREAENLLKKRMEAAQIKEKRDEAQEAHSSDYRLMLSGWKERHSRDFYALTQINRALKVAAARKHCRAVGRDETWLWVVGNAVRRREWVKIWVQTLRLTARWRGSEGGMKEAVKGIRCYKARKTVREMELTRVVLRKLFTRLMLHHMSSILTAIATHKRQSVLLVEIQRMVYSYVSVRNQAAVRVAHALRSTTFHRRRPSVEIRDPTPDLSIIDGRNTILKPPLFSAAWMEQATAAADLYTSLHLSEIRDGLNLWRKHVEIGKNKEKAVIKVQSFLRMCRWKRAYKSLKAVVSLLQTHIRAWSFKRRSTAALVIQRIYRSHFYRNKTKKEHLAATCVQRYYRGYVARRRLRKRYLAVRKIQRAVRRKHRCFYVLRS